MSGSRCKEKAKELLKKEWVMAFVILLIYSAIMTGLGTITGGIGSLLLGSCLLIAVYNVFINAYHGKKYEVTDMLEGWNEGLSNRICLSLLKNVFIVLWSLLFIIPGVVKSYSYFLAEFISRKHPEMTATECITESRKIMNGHKWELFEFQFSFIGWYLLGVITCGIAYIWVLPYVMQATVIYVEENIYKVNKDETLKVEVISE